MQALGSYKGGRMLFLGLGTGLGSAMIVENVLVPMELAHLRFAKGLTYEDFVGKNGMEKYGKKKWRKYVDAVVTCLKDALQADYVVLGGGNAKKLKKLPPKTRLGENANAFLGGFRMWQGEPGAAKRTSKPKGKSRARAHAAPARRVVKRRAPAMAATPPPATATVLGGELSNENPQ
jgi:polyphosphate glucokinase